MELITRWFPRKVDRKVMARRLADFYANRAAYHEMTSSGDKAADPQVRLLLCLLKAGDLYAEIGCGSGAVCRAVAEIAQVIGFDISPLALKKGRNACAGLSLSLICASAEQLPLASNSVAGVYAFEVLEHLWDPVSAVLEMVRIVRPGGFILLSMPNRFSLDLYIPKKALARAADLAAAFVRRGVDRWTGVAYVNVSPDVDGDVYPDCDMVTAIVPANFAAMLESTGCRVEFWDTTYMCAHRPGSGTSLDFQRNTRRPFFRNFGDHCLLLARKQAQAPT